METMKMNTNSEDYLNQVEADRAIRRIKGLMEEGCSHREICGILAQEGYKTIKGKEWTPNNIRVLTFRLRQQCKTWYGLSARRAGLVLKPRSVKTVARPEAAHAPSSCTRTKTNQSAVRRSERWDRTRSIRTVTVSTKATAIAQACLTV
jgi:hypothetical protein